MTASAGFPPCSECTLRHAGPFKDLEVADLRAVAELKTELRFALAHTDLIRDGDKQASFATLFNGWAFSYKILFDGRRQILSILLPGDVIGLDAVVLGQAHASVQTLTDASACIIAVNDLPSLMMSHPSLAQRLLWRSADDRRRADRLLINLGVGTTRERLAAFLLDLHARLHRRGLLRGTAFAIPMTQSHIADHLGVNVVHLNRVLRRFREEGLVAFREQTVLLHDIDRLKAIAGPFQDPFDGPAPLI